MKAQCLCQRDNGKDDEVAVPARAQEHGRYCPTPPHPTANDDESAVPVSSWKDDEGAQVSEILGAQVSAWPPGHGRALLLAHMFRTMAYICIGSGNYEPCLTGGHLGVYESL